MALSSHRVELLLDCSRDDIREVIESELLAVLAHEIHHSLRMKQGAPSLTLAEQLIMEGLACHFEYTITDGKQSSLFTEFHDYDWLELLAKMTFLLHESDFPFSKIFLGLHPEEFPKYAGYWVGYNLVSRYAARCKVTDINLVTLPAEVFFDALQSNGRMKST